MTNHRKSSQLSYRSLEDRRVLASFTLADGGLRIVGTEGAENVRVSLGDDYFRVQDLINDNVEDFAKSEVNRIEFWGLGGNDALELVGDSVESGNLSLELIGFYGNSGHDLFFIHGHWDSARVLGLGGDGGDTLVAGSTDTLFSQAVEFYGGDGNDFLRGGYGADTLSGQNGIDHIFGGAGEDLLSGGAGNDNIDGGADDDRIFGGADQDNLHGGRDFTGPTGTLYFSGNDTIFGGTGQDSLIGDNGNDILHGNQGFDVLYGMDGDDFLYGHSGNDTLYGGDGNDRLEGHAGVDTLNGFNGDDLLFGGTENDTIVGGRGNDVLNGSEGSDTLLGQAGNDRLIGGGSWINFMDGGSGNDLLIGGTDADRIIGGPGIDTFVDTLEDSILFSETEDILRPQITLADFIGMTSEDAHALADSMDRRSRTTQEDGQCFLVTQDYRARRLNFAVEDGRVVFVQTDSGQRAGVRSSCDLF